MGSPCSNSQKGQFSDVGIEGKDSHEKTNDATRVLELKPALIIALAPIF